MSVTSEGKRFLLAVVIIGFAALNTGNNLIYLIFSMMLSILLFALLIPFVDLRNLSIEFRIEGPVFVDTPSSLHASVQNMKRILPSYSFRVILPRISSGSMYFSRIPPGEKRKSKMKIAFSRRGFFTVKDATLTTEFPFIFFSFHRNPGGATQFLVYPRVYDVRNEIGDLTFQREGSRGSMIGKGEEFLHIRNFRYGDSIKHIHWKASAKIDSLMVKEFYESEAEKITIILDNFHGDNSDHFEKAISFAASLASECIHQGYTLRVLTCLKTIPFGSGMEHLYKILDILAVLRRHREMDIPVADTLDGMGILILSEESSPFVKYASLCSKTYHAGNL
jgi:uncharacterized protein (DUF58 family)